MKHQEDDLQLACVQWFTMQYPKLSKALHHSPGGEKRPARSGKRLKDRGMRKGFPDLALYLRSEPLYSGLAVELKIKPNKLSAEQDWWLGWLGSQGWQTAVCYDLDQFMDVVKRYLL